MKIKEIRTATGDNQQTMAQEVGVSIVTIGNWERANKGLNDLTPLARKSVESYARRHKVDIKDCTVQ